MMENRTTIQVSDGLRRKLRILAAKRDISYQKLLSDMISVFEELDKEKTIISIPGKLADNLHNTIKNTDFKTISEYVTFIVRLIMYENSEKSKEADLTHIKKKLKSLGYL